MLANSFYDELFGDCGDLNARLSGKLSQFRGVRIENCTSIGKR